jgi:hypothetical protein
VLVSTWFPDNPDISKACGLIEVSYLQNNVGGGLIEPACNGLRVGIDREGCVIGQLKFDEEV